MMNRPVAVGKFAEYDGGMPRRACGPGDSWTACRGSSVPTLRQLVDLRSYGRVLRRMTGSSAANNPAAALWVPPGHFYSPLVDTTLAGESGVPFDGVDYWEHIDLRSEQQRAYYAELTSRHPALPFPANKTPPLRYHTVNNFFPFSDAYTLSAILRHERPRRVVEIGSGFSSAVMLDTLDHAGLDARLTFVEPYPDRLHSLLTDADRSRAEIITRGVQEVPLSTFEQLEAQDVLFIDSSHVAKVGSDVTHLFLRILPRLRAGVLVHVHDIFYPKSYPSAWLREGRAWNESLFLRTFLIGNASFEITAFNSFAGAAFPELFAGPQRPFLDNFGGSFWMRKIA